MNLGDPHNPTPEEIQQGLRRVEIDSEQYSAEPLKQLQQYSFEGSNRTAIEDIANLYEIAKDQLDPKYKTIFHIAKTTQEQGWPISETIYSILESLEKDINSESLGEERGQFYFTLKQKLKTLARHYGGEKDIAS